MNLGNDLIMYASSSSAIVEEKPATYLDEALHESGGKKCYRQLDWAKIIADK